MFFLIPFELQLYYGGWQAPADWIPSRKDGAPNPGDVSWPDYARQEYGHRLLEALLPSRRRGPGRLETGIIEAYQLTDRLSRLAAMVVDGGMRSELCPVLTINLHLTRLKNGTPLLVSTTRVEVERLCAWLVRCGAGWVSGRQMYKRIVVDVG